MDEEQPKKGWFKSIGDKLENKLRDFSLNKASADVTVGFQKDERIDSAFADSFLGVLKYKVVDKSLWDSLRAYTVKVPKKGVIESIDALTLQEYAPIIRYAEQSQQVEIMQGAETAVKKEEKENKVGFFKKMGQKIGNAFSNAAYVTTIDVSVGFEKNENITGEFAEKFLGLIGYKVVSKDLWDSLRVYTVNVPAMKLESSVNSLSNKAYSPFIRYAEPVLQLDMAKTTGDEFEELK